MSDISKRMGLAFGDEGDAIIIIGGHGSHLGQSMYLREVLGREDGTPPPVNLEQERRNGKLIRKLIRNERVTAVHDISDGGLIAALAEMALASGHGAIIDLPEENRHALLFGEDQARYVITAPPLDAHSIIGKAEDLGIAAPRIGTVTGDSLNILGSASISLEDLHHAHEDWLPGYMDG